MAWTQEDLDKINAAIATGARRVKFQTHEVEYHAVSEMMRVRKMIMDDLANNASGGVMFAEYEGGTE